MEAFGARHLHGACDRECLGVEHHERPVADKADGRGGCGGRGRERKGGAGKGKAKHEGSPLGLSKDGARRRP
jgi:hypothetical protein